MPFPLITQADLEARAGKHVVRRVLDDENTGAALAGAVDRVLKDASSKMLGVVRGLYGDALVTTIVGAAAPTSDPELVRLTLNFAHAYLAQRHPEAVRMDWEPLWKAAQADVKDLRDGRARLMGATPPEPAANVGLEYGDEDFDDATWEPTWSECTSDY